MIDKRLDSASHPAILKDCSVFWLSRSYFWAFIRRSWASASTTSLFRSFRSL